LKSTFTLLVLLSLFVAFPAMQNAAAQASARTDVYHVTFIKAALGKGAELGDYLKKPAANTSMPEHRIALRHESGEDWDYVVIQHLGTKATIDAAGNPPPANARDLGAWHGDTFVNGPAWPEFAKAMGLDDAAKSAGSVYVVSVYRAAPGHRDELEKSLAQPGTGTAGDVMMQHLEGGPWQFLAVARYSSWEDLARGEKADSANAMKPDSGWIGVRNHSTYHNDTITDRVAP